ncbi:glycosyltransferase, partial [Ciceribacter naphthalenivorans]|uniref:glycosyltransferase n=2 Tax=Pseudomonadota TaxID=1224 RepID=UPI0011BF1C4E
MNIVMFTNTFTPHVGGVAHSVAWLAEDLRRLGHRVLVVAPEYGVARNDEPDILRVPAVRHFAGSDFSLPLPLARLFDDALDCFRPDIVHSHHPFLLGTLALRVAAELDRPVVYTYHTRYECYCHHVAPDARAIQRLVLSLSFGYCDLCDAVVAPSASIARHLTDHGVRTPVSQIPTGVDLAFFASGDGGRARTAAGIPADAFVVGHVGRLAAEKNLEFLAEAVLPFLRSHEAA